jgi:hypothetical protein
MTPSGRKKSSGQNERIAQLVFVPWFLAVVFNRWCLKPFAVEAVLAQAPSDGSSFLSLHCAVASGVRLKNLRHAVAVLRKYDSGRREAVPENFR